MNTILKAYTLFLIKSWKRILPNREKGILIQAKQDYRAPERQSEMKIPRTYFILNTKDTGKKSKRW